MNKKLFTLFIFFALPCVMFAQMSVAISTTNASCNSVCDGSATATTTGGTPPYTYLWMPTSSSVPIVSGLCPGTYTVTVTDQLAGTATATCVITAPNSLNVTCTANPSSTICAGSNVSFMLSATGGVPPYTFNWTFPGAIPSSSTLQNPTVQYNTPGNYNAICTVADANGCIGSMTQTITVSGGPTVAMSAIEPICNQNNGSATATPTGNAPFTYNWSPTGAVTPTTIGLSPGGYTCTVTDASGCTTIGTIVLQDSCDYVWPGDANDDAVADNIDILDIGIANGATGTTRANATTNWIGQPSTAWGQTLLSGTDYKWVDCDGDGTIAPLDTQAVVLNYGMIHANRYIAPIYSATGPTLSVSFDQDSVGGGNNGTLTLSLGDTNVAAAGVYGLAFRLNYDAAQLSTSSFGFTSATSWMGTAGNDMMHVVLHPNAAMGYVDVAITRLDHQNVSGSGTIGQIYFTATTALNGSGTSVEVPMTISNVVLIDNAELPQLVNVIGDTVVVADEAIITSVAPNQTTAISVYPNPASDHINVVIPEGEQQLVTIEDVTGRVVYSQYHKAGANTISVVTLPAGAYVLHVADSNGASSTTQIAITR